MLYSWLTIAQAEDGATTDSNMSELEARLLGPQEEVPSTQSMMVEPTVPMWLFPVFVAVVALAVFLKFRQGKVSHPGDIRLKSKIPLGREGALAVVDVTMSNGQVRPMLMGLSNSSAPRLITFLDNDSQEDLVSAENYKELEQAIRPATYTATSYNANGRVVSAPVESNDDDFDQLLNNLAQKQDDLELENRNDLVNEILQERGLEQQESDVDLGFGLTVAKEPEEDPWVAGFQKRYKQKSQM